LVEIGLLTCHRATHLPGDLRLTSVPALGSANAYSIGLLLAGDRQIWLFTRTPKTKETHPPRKFWRLYLGGAGLEQSAMSAQTVGVPEIGFG
jgi:hypothetical protein